MLVDGVLGELGGAGGLQEGRLADLALDVPGLDVLEEERRRARAISVTGTTERRREGGCEGDCPQGTYDLQLRLSSTLGVFRVALALLLSFRTLFARTQVSTLKTEETEAERRVGFGAREALRGTHVRCP